MLHRAQSQYRGRAVVAKMREIISRQMYDVAIQAAIGANIIARETIKALRKNVLAKCYGGDISRKKKAPGKTKGRQKTYETSRIRGSASRSILGYFAGGRLSAVACRATPMGGLV